MNKIMAASLSALLITNSALAVTGSNVLYIQSADSADLQTVDSVGNNYILTLNNIKDTTLWFSERPGRVGGSLGTEHFIQAWHNAIDAGQHALTPPHVTLVSYIMGPNPSIVERRMFELSEPEYDASMDTITYKAHFVHGDPVSGDLHLEFAALFIDGSFCTDSICF